MPYPCVLSSDLSFTLMDLKTVNTTYITQLRGNFGARKVSGIIVSLIDESSFVGNLKSIIDVDDNTPVLSNELWKLVNWISH